MSCLPIYLVPMRVGLEVESGDIDMAVFLNEPAVDFVFDVKIDLYLDLTRALKRNDIDLVMMNRCKNLMLLYGIISDGYVIFDGDPATRIDYEQRLLHQAIDFIGQRKMALGI